ncbi:hypothetical protein [Lactiplantibacillus plantarum]|uniref:phosphoribosylanthranilate isomerase n=1 Tax=Lactiplantibacillus plantarum TaxID=1590 RepID=UPI00280C38E8|nr:hypothetical protein [Lactiplantibacillus plantarum]
MRSLTMAAHVPVIQAMTPANATQCQADYLLLDNARPGSGQVLDWNQLQSQRPVRPFILAGGLTIDEYRNGNQQGVPGNGRCG